MSAQNIVSLGFNVEELTAEKKQVLDLFVDLFGKLQEYDGTKFNPLGNGGLVDLKKSLTDGAAAMTAFGETAKKYNELITKQKETNDNNKKSTDSLTAAQKEHQKVVDQLAATQTKVNEAGSDASQQLAQQKLALQQLAAENKNAAKEALGLVTEYDRLQQAFKTASAEAQKIGAALGVNSEEFTAASQKANALNDQLKAIDAGVGNFQRNVGNYAGSLSPAFAALKDQLESVNEQIGQIETRGKGVQNLSAQPIGFQNDRFKGNSNTNTTDRFGGAAASSVLPADSEAYQKLIVQQKILEGSLERQTVGFKTANQELRNTKNTLDALTLAGGGNTEAFDKLNVAYTTAEQKVKDLHREQAILETDAPALTALTGVAKGLGGAYALGAGAAALFATGNEKVDKELTKLVAVMTFLQGLTEAVSALKERNAIATALEAEATKALNIVRQIEAAIFSKSADAIKADSEAKVLNTAATEASAEATVINTEVLEATTAATEATEAATISLRTALIGTGIGAILIAAAVAIGYLVSKIIEWNNADEIAIKLQGDLAEITKKLNETISSEIELLATSNKDQVDGLKDQLALMEAAGLNREKEFATKTKIAELEKNQADKAIHAATEQAFLEQSNLNSLQFQAQKKKELADLNDRLKHHDIDALSYSNQLNAINTKYNTDQITRENALAKSRDFHKQQYETGLIELQNLQEAQANDVLSKKTIPESLTKRIENMQKVVDSQKDATEKINALIELGRSTTSAVEVQKTDIVTFNEEERRKIILAGVNVEADYVKSKNALILADDRSTLDQRIAALKSNAEQERKIAEAQKNDVLANPGSSGAEKSIAIEKAAEEEKKITESTNAEVYKTTVEWNDKLLAFRNEAAKNQLEGDAAVQKAISDNDTKQLDVRLTALYKNIDDRAQAIAGDYALQLKLAVEHNKTQEEFDKIRSDRTKAYAELNANVEKEIYDTVVSFGEKRLKAIEEQDKAQNSVNDVSSKYNRESAALDKSLSDNLISVLTYDEKRKKLDEQYAIDSADAEVKDDQIKLQHLKDYQSRYLDIQAAFAKGQLEIAKASGDPDRIAKAQAEVDAITKVQAEGADAITALLEKMNKDIDTDNKAHSKNVKDAASALKDDLKKLAAESVSAAISLYDDAHEKRIQQIEIETERADAASQEEIAAVQRSTLSSRQQSEEEAILTAQQKARDTAAKKEERAEKVAEAKFDRDVAVAKVIWSTGAAILKTFEDYGFSPLGIAGAATLAALGAVEVATILSKPIPTYAEGIGIPGKGQHPGGYAVAGEAGPELVSMPGHSPFVVDEPTLINLPAQSSVMPLGDGSSLVYGMGSMAISRNAEIISRGASDSMAIVSALNANGRRMERAFKKGQKKIINQIHIHTDTGGLPLDYFHAKIRGKKI